MSDLKIWVLLNNHTYEHFSISDHLIKMPTTLWGQNTLSEDSGHLIEEGICIMTGQIWAHSLSKKNLYHLSLEGTELNSPSEIFQNISVFFFTCFKV